MKRFILTAVVILGLAVFAWLAVTHYQYFTKGMSRFERWLVILGVLQLLVFALQLAVFGYQAWRLRQTVEAASQQSVAMQRSVDEAVRSADAMERVAVAVAASAKAAEESVATVRERTAAQMRAYLSIMVGNAVYQERDKNLRFQGSPMLFNSGHTPAYKVGFTAKAAIMPIPLPEDFGFPLVEPQTHGGVLGPQQNRVINAMVDDFCDDAEVNDIKSAKGKALHVWGRVTYEDAFRESHFTDFCLILLWLPNGQVTGFFTNRHNDAN